MGVQDMQRSEPGCEMKVCGPHGNVSLHEMAVLLPVTEEDFQTSYGCYASPLRYASEVLLFISSCIPFRWFHH